MICYVAAHGVTKISELAEIYESVSINCCREQQTTFYINIFSQSSVIPRTCRTQEFCLLKEQLGYLLPIVRTHKPPHQYGNSARRTWPGHYRTPVFVYLRCVALRCVALRCVALRCVALRCVVLRCVVLFCVVLCWNFLTQFTPAAFLRFFIVVLISARSERH